MGGIKADERKGGSGWQGGIEEKGRKFGWEVVK